MKLILNNPSNTRVLCSQQVMAECLAALPENSEKSYAYLANKKKKDFESNDVYLFRSGAKLHNTEIGVWYIKGYSADRSDVKAAKLELLAAFNIRNAIRNLVELERVMHVPERFRLAYKGIWAIYPSGQRSPSKLNYEPRVEGYQKVDERDEL